MMSSSISQYVTLQLLCLVRRHDGVVTMPRQEHRSCLGGMGCSVRFVSRGPSLGLLCYLHPVPIYPPGNWTITYPIPTKAQTWVDLPFWWDMWSTEVRCGHVEEQNVKEAARGRVHVEIHVFFFWSNFIEILLAQKLLKLVFWMGFVCC